MRIIREYFGLDRTTVVYDNDISGVGGNTDEFFVIAEVGKSDGTSAAARTTVTFSHDEMTRILADYRRRYPIDNAARPRLISGRAAGIFLRIRYRLAIVLGRCCGVRQRNDSDEHQDRTCL